MRPLLAVACVLVLGCGGATKTQDTAATVDPLQDVGAGIIELRRDLESTVLENYSHLSLGNLEAYADSIAREGPIALIGPRPSDLIVAGPRSRDRRLFSERDVQIYSKNLEMHLSEDGASAWVADELSYRVPHENKQAALSLRYSAVFERRVGRWVMVAEHLSYPVAVDRVVGLARGERFPKLSKMGKNLSDSTETVASIARRIHVGDADYRKTHFSAAQSSLHWLPGPAGEFRGEAIWKAPRLIEYFGGTASTQRTGIVASVTASESIAWVAEQVFLRVRAYDEEFIVPIRGLYVFEKTGNQWQVVQSHLSVPLSNELLSELVFGQGEAGGETTAASDGR